MSTKIVIGNNIGAAPVKVINDSFFTAVHRGATSNIVHDSHKAKQRQQFIDGYVSMGFTPEQAEAIYNGE